MSFTATINRGFHMDFKNGVSISVQWGHGNYCANRDLKKDYLASMKDTIFSCENAEILIEKNGQNITSEFADSKGIRNDGTCAGWMDADMVAEAIMWAKMYGVNN